MLYLKTYMVQIDYGGLETGKYIEMVETTLSTVKCFASHRSVWLIEEKIKVNSNFQNCIRCMPRAINFSQINLTADLQPGHH